MFLQFFWSLPDEKIGWTWLGLLGWQESSSKLDPASMMREYLHSVSSRLGEPHQETYKASGISSVDMVGVAGS